MYRTPPKGAIVLSLDEKTSIQARERRHPSQPAAPGRAVLRNGDFTSRDDLIDKMDTWMIQRNEHARAFRWSYQGIPLKEATCPLH